jgi:hypothetical protein
MRSESRGSQKGPDSTRPPANSRHTLPPTSLIRRARYHSLACLTMGSLGILPPPPRRPPPPPWCAGAACCCCAAGRECASAAAGACWPAPGRASSLRPLPTWRCCCCCWARPEGAGAAAPPEAAESCCCELLLTPPVSEWPPLGCARAGASCRSCLGCTPAAAAAPTCRSCLGRCCCSPASSLSCSLLCEVLSASALVWPG